jgi:hypothetical protein
MGLIHIELFATLDLVGQSPGRPDEDPAGFAFGGWQAPLVDEVAGAQIGAAYEGTDALLLGRRTYDIFAAYWPYQEGEGNRIATLFNGVPKYVASRGRPDLSWAGSTQLGPDLAGALREVRDRHEHGRSSAAWIWCRPSCASSSSTVSTSGCTRSCSVSGRRCSTVARCPRTSRSANRPSPARRAPCTCATGAPMARPGWGT